MNIPEAVTVGLPLNVAPLQSKVISLAVMKIPFGKLYVPGLNVVEVVTTQPSVGVLPHSVDVNDENGFLNMLNGLLKDFWNCSGGKEPVAICIVKITMKNMISMNM